MAKIKTINVKGTQIILFNKGNDEFISITDIARFKNATEPKDVVKNWMRSKTTIEFLGLWERINNPNFKGVEFDAFMFEAGSNSFVLSPSKWIESTNAIGIISKVGSGGGTYAHIDIALEFASWVSAEFKLYLLIEFKRLKSIENERLNVEWNLHRTISKINCQIHTDAIKEHISPISITKEHTAQIYASEADVLNVALFGKTAKQWRAENDNVEGNIRDQASLEQLLVLANLESLNAEFIKMGLQQSNRLLKLNQTAITQLSAILGNKQTKKLK